MPYEPSRYSSGSGGGAATAVATGLLPVAHGGDSAGSGRAPAATCHLVGVRPGRGLVSPAPATAFFSTGAEGAMWTETGLDTVDPHPQSVLAARTATPLRELGHGVREIAIPARWDEPVRRAVVAWFASAVGVAAPALVPDERRHLLRPFTRRLLDVGDTLSARDVMTVRPSLSDSSMPRRRGGEGHGPLVAFEAG